MTLLRVLPLVAFAAVATLASTATAQNYDTAPIPPEWVAPDAQAPSSAPQPPGQAAPPQGAPPPAAPTSGPPVGPPGAAPAPLAPIAPAKPPPRRMEPYSKPMMIGGGVAAGLGAWLLLFGGLGGFDDDDHTNHADDDTRTTASVVLGSVFVLGGTPLLIIGAQSVPVDEGQARRAPVPSKAPRVRLSATSADATWAF